MSPLDAFIYIVAFGAIVFVVAVAVMLLCLALSWLWRKL